MQTVIIRPAGVADIAAITRIYADAVIHGTASFEIEPPDKAEMTRRQAALIGNGYPYLAAEIDGMVAGYAYAGPYRTRPINGVSKTRSTSLRICTAKALAVYC